MEADERYGLEEADRRHGLEEDDGRYGRVEADGRHGLEEADERYGLEEADVRYGRVEADGRHARCLQVGVPAEICDLCSDFSFRSAVDHLTALVDSPNPQAKLGCVLRAWDAVLGVIGAACRSQCLPCCVRCRS